VDLLVGCSTSCLRLHRHYCTEACRIRLAVHRRCRLVLELWVVAHTRSLGQGQYCIVLVVVHRIVGEEVGSYCCWLAGRLRRASNQFHRWALRRCDGDDERFCQRALVAGQSNQLRVALQTGAEDEGEEEQNDDADQNPTSPIAPGG
jgi:hypothetical protein